MEGIRKRTNHLASEVHLLRAGLHHFLPHATRKHSCTWCIHIHIFTLYRVFVCLQYVVAQIKKLLEEIAVKNDNYKR